MIKLACPQSIRLFFHEHVFINLMFQNIVAPEIFLSIRINKSIYSLPYLSPDWTQKKSKFTNLERCDRILRWLCRTSVWIPWHPDNRPWWLFDSAPDRPYPEKSSVFTKKERVGYSKDLLLFWSNCKFGLFEIMELKMHEKCRNKHFVDKI